MRTRDIGGFTMVEALVAMTLLMTVMTGVATMMIQSSRLNKTQHMKAQVQADARVCLSMMIQRMRSAGWDPLDIGFDGVVLDSDDSDDVSEIVIRADLNDDGDIDDDGESLTIRHEDDRVAWRLSDAADFVTLAVNITNDADGDGTPEPMFVPDADPPQRITVTITARSAALHPITKEFIRYTVSSDVVLREAL